MTSILKPKVYMKSTCPFCFKFLLFLSEAGLLEQFEIISADGNDDAEMDKYREFLQEETGQAASFPTVEIAPGEYLADSDVLIDYFAAKHEIDKTSLQTLAYYLQGPFKAQISLFKENRALKEQLGS
ncbi:glutathione S-transferase N-terminal domain-containing protein [Malonomonas rubra]|uniref:glutaredoxin family protein n=1 Tax=Malonomonas rubra TaxID=57040 RepID=UPI0026F03ECA|nr:glutathione S-transferase N-terminal domain-containing protein [Malonomonas rubra]